MEPPSTLLDREKSLKWNGWGYKDSFFYLNDRGQVSFTGDRYEISGKVLPNLRKWMEENLEIDVNRRTPCCNSVPLHSIPLANLHEGFVKWLKTEELRFSDDPELRVNRSHGHTVHDIVRLRRGSVGRIPDLVVWPQSAEEVAKIVLRADADGVAIIPLGGGTSVSGGLWCPEGERRCIICLDLCLMNRLLWVDEENQIARAEAGAIGAVLEEQLNRRGFTLGHEPDSLELSSLGGWVATRASGMKKNKYGNIEDLVVHVSLATPRGVLEKSSTVPRVSAGPDIHHFIFGSEGILGVITEVTFKIFRLPECRKYGSVLFENFSAGVGFLREVAKQRCSPAAIRLMDNEQFRFGQALKPAPASALQTLGDVFKRFYVTRWKGLDPEKMCSVVLVLEGPVQEVQENERRIYNIAKNFGGIPAGEANGRFGYLLTFAIAYLRDFGMEFGCLGESFETSVPWTSVEDVCRNVKELLHRESQRRGISRRILASCRVSQIYDSGACVYFYFGFNSDGLENDPLDVYSEIEEMAREEIFACGGSISHHHGVGKLRSQWLERSLSPAGLTAIRALKSALDPNNVFASGNLLSMSKL